jgi:glutathione synthase/RimK-type ligase-like ATP-grasp enzyme
VRRADAASPGQRDIFGCGRPAVSRARQVWLGCRRLVRFGIRSAKRFLGLERTVYVGQRVREYRGYWEGAALRIGAEFRDMADNVWEVRRDGRRTRLCGAHVQLNDPVVSDISANKKLCYDLASRAGLPIPNHTVFTLAELERAVEFLERRPGLYVVKPAGETSSGIGVTTQVRTRRQLASAAILASLFASRLLVEEMIPGESCRLLYIGGEFVHAVRRRGTRVSGDGTTTVAGLMRALEPRSAAIDTNAVFTLRAQGLAPRSVVEAGRELLVRSLPPHETRTRELRTVYTEEITSEVGPALREEIGRIVAAVESRLAGVDIVTLDPRLSLGENGGAFLEVNPAPGIHHHYVSEEDHKAHPVATKLLEYLLQERR